MGTRNLITVIQNGEYKIAQYGQWDGYPSGQGADICKFLSKPENIEKLKNNLSKCRFLDAEGQDKEFIEAYDRNTPEWSNEPDNRTPEQKRWFATYISRDLGAKILTSVAESTDDEIILRNSLNFAADSLSCEYAYVIDLDNEKLEVHEGYKNTPLTESDRFYFLSDKSDDGYYPVRKIAEFPFSDATAEAMSNLENAKESAEVAA